MMCVQSASGDASRALGKLLTIFVLAYASYLVITNLHVKALLESALPVTLPFKSLAVLGGVMYILWICLAYRLCGPGFGVATALIISSLCLATSLWFGVANPWWFSVYCVISFLVAGILCERVHGALANAVFGCINWVAAYVHHVAPLTLAGLGVGLALAAVSGAVGDYIARGVSRALLSIEVVRSFYAPSKEI